MNNRFTIFTDTKFGDSVQTYFYTSISIHDRKSQGRL